MGDTGLMEFADKLRTSAQNGRGRTFDGETGTFPMYTVPTDVLLQMEELRAHEEMLEAGALVQFESSMGKAMFVSHQWLSAHHPDPDIEQLKVLQQALRNIGSGASLVHLPVATELYNGRCRCPTAELFKPSSLYIWYDYCSCPQGTSANASLSRRSAIDSIPVYVARCYFFVILCPALRHADEDRMLSQSSWVQRGWCRTERVAIELAEREDGYIIVIESATYQTLAWLGNRTLEAPGQGQFSVEADKGRVGGMMVRMVWAKLLYHLEHGDLHNYRFLLNSQTARFFKGLDVMPVDGIVPSLRTEVDPCLDPEKFVLDWFLHQNGFRSALQRDHGGWTPLCFAAVRGDPRIIQALLDHRANPNDMTTKARGKEQDRLPKKSRALGLATFFGNIDAAKLLLSARASANALDENYGTPLHWACGANSAEGVRLLLDAHADPHKKCLPGLNPFHVSCVTGSPSSLREILAQVPALSLRHSLHLAFMFSGGGYPATITQLIQARADVNEQFQIQMQETGWWLILNVLGLRHRVSPSKLTLLAYHHHLATPLMFSILSGYLEAASVLLAAGARVDMRNYRKKSAADLASQMLAPSWLRKALEHRSEDVVDEDVFSI